MKLAHARALFATLVFVSAACGEVEDNQSWPDTTTAAGAEVLGVPGSEPEEELAAPEGENLAAAATSYRWQLLPGGARDVAAASRNYGWVVGTNAYSGGFQLYEWRPSDNRWIASNIGGSRIGTSATFNRPWIVKNNNQIWYWNGTINGSTVWSRYAHLACAKDIGAKPFSEGAWVIGCDNTNGNASIYEIYHPARTPIKAAGGAVRVAVDDLGIPWVINARGTVYRRNSTSANTGAWQAISGSGRAYDIGAGQGGAWIISRTVAAGGFQVQYYAGGTSWIPVTGGGIEISVGWDGVPWLRNDRFQIFRGVGFN